MLTHAWPMRDALRIEKPARWRHVRALTTRVFRFATEPEHAASRILIIGETPFEDTPATPPTGARASQPEISIPRGGHPARTRDRGRSPGARGRRRDGHRRGVERLLLGAE